MVHRPRPQHLGVVLSLLAVGLAASLAFVGCDDKPSGGGGTSASTTAAATTSAPSASTSVAASASSAAPTASASATDTAAPSASGAPSTVASAKPSDTGKTAPTASASDTTTAAASASAAPAACGGTGQPKCPLQGWMGSNLGAPMKAADAAKLAAGLRAAAKLGPAGYSDWAKYANDGAAAVEKSKDVADGKASCKSCHNAYQKKYRAEMRDRPLP